MVANKIHIIKMLREDTNLGLKQAKDLVDEMYDKIALFSNSPEVVFGEIIVKVQQLNVLIASYHGDVHALKPRLVYLKQLLDHYFSLSDEEVAMSNQIVAIVGEGVTTDSAWEPWNVSNGS